MMFWVGFFLGMAVACALFAGLLWLATQLKQATKEDPP